MRFVVLMLALLGACQTTRFGGENGGGGGGSESGSGSDEPAECGSAGDCALAATMCCECPAFAVPVEDPAHTACEDVQCTPAPTCPNNVTAACVTGRCVLACEQMACAASCADGYAIDSTTGCLSCTCAAPPSPTCSVDSDCVRTRADCCGCLHGGEDTAVPTADQASFDASLDCPSNPTCPSADSCAAGLTARCVEGACELAPATPTGACGSASLATCPTGQACMINVDSMASQLGLGVCMSSTE